DRPLAGGGAVEEAARRSCPRSWRCPHRGFRRRPVDAPLQEDPQEGQNAHPARCPPPSQVAHSGQEGAIRIRVLCWPLPGQEGVEASGQVSLGARGRAGLPAAAQAIMVGATSSTSDAPIYIADKKGYFRDEGLDVKVTNFRSAAAMVAPLGAGQIEAGAGSASAGLYNAVARGIKIKIVADKASSPPGYGGTKVLVRKDHLESGRYRSLPDLKGMKFAMNAPGVSNTSTLNTLLQSAGLKYSDVETVDLPLPDHVAALKNKSVDASASVEPGPALAI